MKKAFKKFILICILLVATWQIAVAWLLVLPANKFDLSERHSGTYKTDLKIEYNKGFNEYLASVEAFIAAENVNAKKIKPGENGETVLELIRPFEWKSEDFDSCAKKNKTGVLLIHGLTDTPYLMRDIGKHFEEKNCYIVRSILLPGHGTKPGHLLEVTEGDWTEATEFGVHSFNQIVDRLYIAGFSTGGGLALNYVLDKKNQLHSPKINGLLLFSPAIELAAGLKAKLANLHKIYTWAYTLGKWIDVAPDEDFAKYESFAKNAGEQVYQVIKKRKKLGEKLEIPVFIVISGDDATINSKGTIEYFNTELNTGVKNASRLLIYKRKVANDLVTKEICSKQNILCIESDKEEGISSYAHTAIPVSSDNIHYGKDAKYYNCVHYIKDKEDNEADKKYKLCKSSSSDIEYAEVVDNDAEDEEIITNKVYRRLTYNPDFSNMMGLVDEFIKTTHKASQIPQ